MANGILEAEFDVEESDDTAASSAAMMIDVLHNLPTVAAAKLAGAALYGNQKAAIDEAADEASSTSVNCQQLRSGKATQTSDEQCFLSSHAFVTPRSRLLAIAGGSVIEEQFPDASNLCTVPALAGDSSEPENIAS